jgi:hypothetical protein
VKWKRKSTTIREAGGLNFRPQAEKIEAFLCFDVELAVAAGLGNNQEFLCKWPRA